MNIKDEIYPKVKADVRMTDDKTLWVKVSKPEFEKIGRIILEDGSVFCKVFYQDTERKMKTGKWIYDDEAYPGGNPYGHYDCDQCGESMPYRTNFCPNCGADMRGKDDGD